jgi:hypothetical protein
MRTHAHQRAPFLSRSAHSHTSTGFRHQSANGSSQSGRSQGDGLAGRYAALITLPIQHKHTPPLCRISLSRLPLTAFSRLSLTHSGPIKQVAHGSLMVLSFGFCMVVGSLIAFAVPKNQAWWFPAHWILQACGGTHHRLLLQNPCH